MKNCVKARDHLCETFVETEKLFQIVELAALHHFFELVVEVLDQKCQIFRENSENESEHLNVEVVEADEWSRWHHVKVALDHQSRLEDSHENQKQQQQEEENFVLADKTFALCEGLEATVELVQRFEEFLYFVSLNVMIDDDKSWSEGREKSDEVENRYRQHRVIVEALIPRQKSPRSTNGSKQSPIVMNVTNTEMFLTAIDSETVTNPLWKLNDDNPTTLKKILKKLKVLSMLAVWGFQMHWRLTANGLISHNLIDPIGRTNWLIIGWLVGLLQVTTLLN